MDIGCIEELIRKDGVDENTPGLPGVVFREIAKLRRLSADLGTIDSEREGLSQAVSELKDAEASARESQTKLVQLKERSRKERSASQAERDSLATELDGLEREIRAEVDGMTVLKREVVQEESSLQSRDRLLKRKKDLSAEKTRLESEIAKLGEEYEANMNRLGILKAFVEELEGVEAEMSRLLEEIWKGLPRDAFDRMC